MSKIALLSQDTIDKIAAGEVIERPASVVKELIENAIDADASAVTVEIKEGGISFIRISDNGYGISANEVPLAFFRHSTSKIRSAEDLLCVSSLGFRGEALSSIAAVSRVELITKTPQALTGIRYQIEGSKEIAIEEVGAPEGTTFLIKDLFFNVPARRKFLKTAQTEGTYIADIVEKLALSHPNISFKLIQNNQTKLHTSGNGNQKDLIYHIFGKEFASSVLPVAMQNAFFHVHGFIGKPNLNRGNRNFEIYFINGRYIKSSFLSKAIEEAYQTLLMQHRYPFCVLYFTFQGEHLDVNVHPTKMELRFDNAAEVYQNLYEGLREILLQTERIPEISMTGKKKEHMSDTESIPEPLEKRKLNDIRAAVAKESSYEIKYPKQTKRQNSFPTSTHSAVSEKKRQKERNTECIREDSAYFSENKKKPAVFEELTLQQLHPEFLTKEAKKKHRVIGQLFQTYWLVEYEEKLFIIDQHAAHEKVLYERMMSAFKEKEYTSQRLSPPIVLSLDTNEIRMLENYRSQFEQMGYEIEAFGGKEYMITAIPANLYNLNMKDLLIEMLDNFSNLSKTATPELILEKIASMSCKAAVKGKQTLHYPEFDALVGELLSLENPYNCPHGRPTIISMSKYELEKKFKRIIS